MAVKRKEPARALRFLKSIEQDNGDQVEEKLNDGSLSIESPRPQLGELGFVGGLERDWKVLDTCLNASDMRPVGGAYGFLKDRGFLPNFGFSSIVSKLSPKKWGSSGTSSIALVALLGGVSYLLSQGIDIRPNRAAILGLAFLDSIFFGGTCLALISSYWPPYRHRILVHEAGHLLVVYTPYRLLNSWSDFRSNRCNADGHPRAGTAFAGIAAEALVCGEAEGGENDENMVRSICVLLQPPLSVAQKDFPQLIGFLQGE